MRMLLPIVLLAACGRAEGTPRPSGPQPPLVVELFTSQGCSSCPPADRLLAQLADDPAIEPLSFHVDYWNDLGWRDPYSQPAWTRRQHAYARALGDARVYTPELVVGGAAGVVGSRAAQVHDAIARASRPAALAARARWRGDALEVTATAPADAEVVVAVYERVRTTAVPRGENAGETLANVHVVRRLARVAPPGHRGTITVDLDPAWRAVGAVAFAQRADRSIIATARLPR